MTKIIERWYFSLILIPIIINLITANLSSSDFLNNWKLTLIGVLIILCLILLYELSNYKKTIKLLKSKPKERDKRIVKELIETLDIIDFEKSIYEQNSWYGYPQKPIRKTIAFTEKAQSINYKTSDNKLNKLIIVLSDSIYDFNEYAGIKLYSEGEFYKPAKENEHNLKITEEATPIMNSMTTKSFENLQNLLKYLRERDYLE
ncbi:hypothetical protein [Tenacibaculum maritimum]|uniref:hypothetical protein n=1 Tax=Tenacibaculum maritimum TaxID=107401 RepID=UPI0013302B1F|nr:hypothetical protein [Tenacibaculum maritimum]